MFSGIKPHHSALHSDRPVRHALKRLRRNLGRPLERALIGRESVSILSEDCWGGEFCRVLGSSYTTPLAGTFILTSDYLTFLENIGARDAFQLEQVESAERFPVGRTPYATIHFMHASSWEEAVRSFARRAARLNRDRLFFKIDFGKAGYTQEDVDRWNHLALPNAVALLPASSTEHLNLSRVHQGWRVKRWSYDGAAMFHLSRRAFDFHHWIRSGRLRFSWLNRALNFLFWDKLVPSEILSVFVPSHALRHGYRYVADDSEAVLRPAARPVSAQRAEEGALR